MNSKKCCGTCAHHGGGTQPKCNVPLPWWAEPHGRPAVYKVEGDDCPLWNVEIEDQ